MFYCVLTSKKYMIVNMLCFFGLVSKRRDNLPPVVVQFQGHFGQSSSRSAPLWEAKEEEPDLFAYKSQDGTGIWVFSLHLQRARARYVGLMANEIHLFLTYFTYNLLNLAWKMKKSF